MENLNKLKSGLSLFCKKSNSMINWHKSCAIWLSHALRPHPNFMLINQGVSTRYLGFQIGFNIAHETMIAPIIHSIQQKSIHWSSKKLSLRGHIIGANQVLLATTWYNIWWWTISKGRIHQIQWHVHYYIWYGKESRATRTRWRDMF